MSALDAVAALLLVLLVADWSAVVMMLRIRRAARRPNTALASRHLTAILISLAATIAGGLAVAQLLRRDVDGVTETWAIAAVFVLMSLPQVHWLWLYWRGTWQ